MTKSRTNKKKSVIAERLKELRTNRDTIAKDFTQRELAKKIFISYSKRSPIVTYSTNFIINYWY